MRRWAALSEPTTMTDFAPSCAVRTEAAGIFQALASVRPVMETLTGVPTLSAPALFSILSQTSTVVLPGSRAGLMRETLAVTGSGRPGTETEASSPSFMRWARLCAMWVLASRLEVSMTVMRAAPAGAVSPAKRERSVTTPLMGAANLRVADLGLRALELALGGGELALGGLEGGLAANAVHGVEVLGGGVIGGLGGDKRGLGGVEVAAGDGALGEEGLAALDDAEVEVEIGFCLGDIGLGLEGVFRDLGPGGRGKGRFGSHIGAFVVEGRGGEVVVFEGSKKLASFYTRSALHIKPAHRRADFGRDGSLRERGENGIGDDVFRQGALLGMLGLDCDLGLGSSFFLASWQKGKRERDGCQQSAARLEAKHLRDWITTRLIARRLDFRLHAHAWLIGFR